MAIDVFSDSEKATESPPLITTPRSEVSEPEWKPHRTAKKRRNRAPVSRMGKNHQKCAVCGDVATGYHYAVLSCNGCKTFFRRTIIARRRFSCSRGGKCDFSKEFRCSCRACRFAKYVAVDMDPRSIHQENGEKEFELPIIFPIESPVKSEELEQAKMVHLVVLREEAVQSLRAKSSPTSFCPDYPLEELLGVQCTIGRSHSGEKKPTCPDLCDEYKASPVRYWTIIDLFLTVEYAKSFVEFQDLSSRDKSELLYNVGMAVQIFSQAYYAFDEKSDCVVFPDGTNALYWQMVKRNRTQHESYYRNCYSRPVDIISQLKFTQQEFALFKAIALFSSEGDMTSASQAVLKRKREDLILIFRKHLVKEYGNQMGLEKLACSLVAIATFIDLAEKRRAYVFLMDLIEKCTFPNLVKGIYLKRLT